MSSDCNMSRWLNVTRLLFVSFLATTSFYVFPLQIGATEDAVDCIDQKTNNALESYHHRVKGRSVKNDQGRNVAIKNSESSLAQLIADLYEMATQDAKLAKAAIAKALEQDALAYAVPSRARVEQVFENRLQEGARLVWFPYVCGLFPF